MDMNTNMKKPWDGRRSPKADDRPFLVSEHYVCRSEVPFECRLDAVYR